MCYEDKCKRPRHNCGNSYSNFYSSIFYRYIEIIREWKRRDDVVPYYEYPTATLTIEEFYSLNYDIPELAGVKSAVDKKDFQKQQKS